MAMTIRVVFLLLLVVLSGCDFNNASSNGNLINITISDGIRDPAFSPEVTSYSATVSPDTDAITVSATVEHPHAALRINGTLVASGSPVVVPLVAGVTTIIADVYADDVETAVSSRTYTVAVTRPEPTTFSVGGTVSGLAGTVTLQNNGADDLLVTADGPFEFATEMDDDADYDVTVSNQPVGQTCSVTDGVGTIASLDVSNISVSCVTNTYSIGGSVSGLVGTIVLQNNAGDDLSLNANGPFTFATPINHGTDYDVTISVSPAGQTCTVSNGQGTVVAADVTDVTVTCVSPTFSVGGTVSGLTGTVVLQNNGAGDLSLSADGPFTIATGVLSGSTYVVTVSTQPAGQFCSVDNGVGTVAAANITNITVTCETTTYNVGGTISGLTGTVVLQNNGADDLSLSANGPFTIATGVLSGFAYDVTVGSQPAGQTCSVADGNGTVVAADVTNITVTCVTPTSASIFLDHMTALNNVSALGDLDGDGDPDMVTNDGVWLNDGIGGYDDSGQNFLAALLPTSLALGDLDGDGDLDLVVGASDFRNNTVWLNDGNGIFSDTGQAIGFSEDTQALVLGDIDGDGDSDLLVGNLRQPNTVWLNNGVGVFTDSGQTLGNSSTTAIALGDMNGDGNLDLVDVDGTRGNGTSTMIWLNDGNGTFTDSGAALGDEAAFAATIGDIDGDGDLDIVHGIYGFDGAPNTVWVNDGSAVFTDTGQALGSQRTQSVALGDADGDGDLDLVDAGVLSTAQNTLWVNDGNGVFTLGQELDSSGALAVAWSDVDGDLDLDLVMSLGSEGSAVYINNANGVFTNGGQRLGNSWTQSIALGDVNGDGILDMVAGNLNQPIIIRLGDAAGNFDDRGVAMTFEAFATRAVALGDVDGDSDLDLYIGIPGAPDALWINDGSASFTNSGQTLSPQNTRSVALGDVDGDGDLDVVLGQAVQPNSVWLNDGGGVFTDSGQALGNAFTVAAVLGDLDGDADLDLVVGDYDLNNGAFNSVWFNDGNGSFADSGQPLSREATADLALGDVDGDGDLDLVEGNSGNAGRANTVWLNDGNATFSDSGQALGNNSTRSIALGDVDNDGDLDMVEGNGGDDIVWLNNGAGTFTDSGQALGDEPTDDIKLGDFDRDGDLDIATATPGTTAPNYVILNQTIR